MGSWYKTCGLTNLPIKEDEDVYVFVLKENSDRSERCYATAYFKPVLLPFESKYNDYGGGKESSGIGLPYIMDGLKTFLVEMEQGKNEYHDIPIKKNEFNVDKFFEAVHESRMFINRNEKIDFVMMKKNSVDYLLNTFEFEMYMGAGLGNRKENKGNYYNYHTYQDIIKDIPNFIDTVKKYLLENNNRLYSIQHLNGIIDKKSSLTFKHLLNIDQYRYCSIAFDIKIDFARFLISFIEENKIEELIKILEEILKGVVINSFFEKTRKLWIPTGHEGSQNNDLYPYKKLIEIIQKEIDFIEEENRKYEEE